MNLLKKIFSLSLIGFLFFQINLAGAATWTQTDWSSGSDTNNNTDVSTADWNKFYSKSDSVTATTSLVLNESSGSFTENFSTTTNKDAANTTANWDTTNGLVTLGRAASDIATNPVGHGPTKFVIDGSFMLDSDTIFVEGEDQGKIYKSDDTGATWSEVYSIGNNFFQIFFLNSTTGWALAACGNIHKTTDGGNNWTQVGTINNCGSADHEIYFVDANTGWFAGSDWNPDSPGLISKTIDGGANWTNQTLPDSAAEMKGIHFINSTTGWAVGTDKNTGQTKILYTGDGGSNWAVQTPPDGFTEPLVSVYFWDANTGWAIGDSGGLIKTTNGGTTWTTITDFGSTTTKIHFIDASTGWISTGNSNVLKTTNGGSSWSTVQVSPINDLPLLNVHFINSTTGIASGDNGNIFKTADGGSSWMSISTGPMGTLEDTHFIDANIGYTVGAGGLIYKTTNRGTSWALQDSLGFVNTLNSVHFYDVNTGWVAGNTGLILRTTNAGGTWNNMTTNISTNLHGIYFADQNTGWAVGENGTIIKTVSGGSIWTAQTSGITQTINAIQCFSTTTCYAAASTGGGNDAMLLTTTDGGSNWNATEIVNGWNVNLSALYFLNTSVGWVASNLDGIQYTTNGGTTWTAALDGEGTIYDIYFTDSSSGFMVKSSSILKSTDGGATWASIRDEWGSDLRGIHFSSATSGYAVGSKGNVFNIAVTLGNYNTPLNAISSTIDNTDQNITKATLTATATLNNQTITYYMSRDGGTTYEEVTSGVEHTFTSAEAEKSNLKWKAILAGTTSVTPVLDQITITYKYIQSSFDQLSTSETFDTTTKKDTPNTTGDWNTTSGQAQLNVATYNATGTDLHRTPTSRHLYGVYFLSDNQTGWAVGERGVIFKTANGGTSWTQMNNFSTYTTETLYDIFFLDANNGWIVGSKTPTAPGPPDAVLYTTTDGGTSWSRSIVTGGNNMKSGFFLTTDLGFMAGSMALNKTANGGTSWTTPNTGLSGEIYGVHAIESAVDVAAAVADSGSISISTDNGDTWSAQELGAGVSLNDVYVINATTILVVGGTNSACKVYKGTKADAGGWSFSEISLVGITCNNKLTGLHYVGGNNFVAAGLGNNIIKSTDNGDNWSSISIGSPTTGESSLNFRDIHLNAADGNGWMVGDNGSIWKTADGGSNWTLLSGSFGGQITDMMFTDANTGWTVFSGDSVNGAAKTTNAGSTWTDKTNNVVMTGPTSGIHALDGNTAWVVHNDAILKTTDGGTNWTSNDAGEVSNLQKLFFVNANTGWAVGRSGVIVKTTDGGSVIISNI